MVGEKGKVFGVDITPKMVEIASLHAKDAEYLNIKILESSFDNIALDDESVDVVISNGAINLTSCKESVFAEIYRILKSNGKQYDKKKMLQELPLGLKLVELNEFLHCTPKETMQKYILFVIQKV